MPIAYESLFGGGGGGGIASIQRGTITIASSTTSNTATISAVDPSKSFVIWNGSKFPGSYSNFSGAFASVNLTNATTVTAERSSTLQDIVVAFTVVEFS